MPGALGFRHLGRPPADRDPCPDQLQQDGKQLAVRFRPEPAGDGLPQQVPGPGITERGSLPAGWQARPGQLVPRVRDGVLEEDAAAVAGVAADHPFALVPAAPAGDGAAVAVQDRAVIPQAADLHPAPGDAADVVGGQQLIEQVRGRDLHREPGLGERHREQRVRAVSAVWIPCRGVLAELATLPDRDDPGGDQVLHLVHGQRCVGGRVGAAVGDVDAGVSGQVLEQQLPDHPERVLAGGLVSRAQHPGRQDVAADHPLRFDEVVFR